MATRREIEIELLPHERDVLLKWIYTPEVRSQLESLAASDSVGTITVAPYLLGWLVSDLNHAIVKRGCRDEEAIELCERLEYVERSGDGRLDIGGW